jgi:M6 family metalloprotease-like protein
VLKRSTILIFLTLVVLLARQSLAAPVWGEQFDLRQPDGSMVKVKIWGDEFYQIVESLDGYTLIRDAQTKEICYAVLSDDKNELLSTGVSASFPIPTKANIERHLRINPAASQAKAQAVRARFRAVGAAEKAAEFVPTTTGNVVGICLLVDFPDEAGTIDPNEVDDFCNQIGYTGYGNYGSIRDYYYDVSDGALTYTNYVVPTYYTAQHNKTYYDDPTDEDGVMIRTLTLEALNWLDDEGFDFSQYDSNGDSKIDAVNIFYAGYPESGWATGLWPRYSEISFYADGVSTYGYQITNLGDSLALDIFCHENGHMVCQWPDLYDYDFDSTGIGNYGLMGYGLYSGPTEPCAYLKYTAGWATVLVLDRPRSNLSVPASLNLFYKYPHPSSSMENEYFLISNRQQSGRDAWLPDAGLAIWHIDTEGSNDYQQMTPTLHYLVTLVQADGNWDMENNINYGDPCDLYDADSYDRCGPDTYPNTNWWSGEPSGMDIHSISSSGQTMTFSFGDLSEYAADVNGDDKVDANDICLVASHWLETDCNEPDWCSGTDINNDQGVNGGDFAIVGGDWLVEFSLRAHWKLDGDASDSSGNGYSGTLYGGPVWDPNGRIGGAIRLDGINDYVKIKGYKGIGGANSRTVTAWVNTESVRGDILSWGKEEAGRGWLFHVNKYGVIKVSVSGGYIQGSTYVADGEWHHVAAVLPEGASDVSEVEIYVDGDIEVDTTYSSRLIDTANYYKVKIGIYADTGRYFDGLIDDVRIYDRALGQGEIEVLATMGN